MHGMIGTMTIRVLIADDHPVVRGGLTALLDSLHGIEVVAETSDGAGAVQEAAIVRPDVAVMDLRMPGPMDGVAATRRIVADYPSTAVLVLTMFDEDALISAALAAGARGYLLKGAGRDEIERAIRAVAAGDVIFSREVADRVLHPAAPAQPSRLPELTVREREVSVLVAQGFTNPEIADRLSIAQKTVGNHVSAIYLKLGVATRAQAVVRIRDAGLGTGEE